MKFPGFKKSFYRFLEVRHYIQRTLKKIDKTDVGILKMFLQGHNSDRGRGHISKL